MKYFSTLLILALTIIISGCSDSSEGQMAENKKGYHKTGRSEERKLEGSEKIYARIDGREITENMISNRVVIQARFVELSKKPISPKRFPYWANSVAAKLFPSMISEEVIVNEIKRRGFVRTDVSDRIVLEKYNKRSKLAASTIDEFVEVFSINKEELRAMIERDSLLESFYASNPACSITDDDVRKYLSSVSNEVNALVKYNERTFAKGQNIYKMLAAGANWDTVAAEYSEDRLVDEENANYYKEWESFRLKDYQDTTVSEALVGLKKGQFTKPLDTDEGLVIVRVNGIEEGVYSCSRILLRLAVISAIPSFEKAKSRLIAEKRTEAQRAIFSEAMKTSKIEYVMGTNFTMRIWSVPKKRGVRLKDGRRFIPMKE